MNSLQTYATAAITLGARCRLTGALHLPADKKSRQTNYQCVAAQAADERCWSAGAGRPGRQGQGTRPRADPAQQENPIRSR